MKFESTPVAQAEGAILVHSVQVAGRKLKKGSTLEAEDIEALRSAGHEVITTARLEDGDVGEDEAALRVARAACGPGIGLGTAFTGRCNLFAEGHGLAIIDRERLDRCNLVDEAVTIATVSPFEPVGPRDLVATVKIIPLAARSRDVEACAAIAADGGSMIRLAPLGRKAAGLIQTRLHGTKERVLDKTVETIRLRLAALGSELVRDIRCGHDELEVAAAIHTLSSAGADLILILGASATVDRRDVVPKAIVRAGGQVDHFGMPVDPGNLTLVGHDGRIPVLGLPGSARSPRTHGFDWILRRLLADLPVSGRDIMLMGAGGLLKEIPARPLPRARASPPAATGVRGPRRVAALVLAAGQSRRMGPVNKLLSKIDGTPMIVRVAAAVGASRADPVIVVTGHQADEVRAALAGQDVTFVQNTDYVAGLSTSLRAGLSALPPGVDGVVVCLGDMPLVSAALIDRLIDAFDPAADHAICVPTHLGKRGNPVLWAAHFFAEMQAVAGDVGARHLIGEHEDVACEVACDDAGTLTDIDTPEALDAIRGEH